MKKKVLKLLDQHIKTLDEFVPSSYTSPVEDKMLSLLNKRFFEKYHTLTGDDIKERAQFLTILREHNVLYREDHVVDDFSCDTPDDYQEQYGYDVFDEDLFKVIKVGHILTYEDCFDEVVEDDVSPFDLLISELTGNWDPEPLYLQHEGFQSLISDITQYFGDGDNYWTFISIPKSKERLSRCKRAKDIFSTLSDFSNHSDEEAFCFKGENEIVLAIWQGYNGYEVSTFCNWKFSFFFRLLYLDTLLREEVAI